MPNEDVAFLNPGGYRRWNADPDVAKALELATIVAGHGNYFHSGMARFFGGAKDADAIPASA